MPGHWDHLGGPISIITAPNAPDAAKRQILKLCKDIRNLFGYFGMILLRDGSRHSIGNLTAG